MPDHKFELLNAYLDGELNARQRSQFEAHLENCPECLEELEALDSLSGMLAEAPLPEFPTPEQLSANVGLKLPRTPQQDAASRTALPESWWLAPASLLLLWLVLSTVSLGANLFGAVSGVDLASTLPMNTGATATYTPLLGQVGLLQASSLEWLVTAEQFIRHFVGSIVWQSALSLLYLSLIVLWWTRHNSQEPNPQFGN